MIDEQPLTAGELRSVVQGQRKELEKLAMQAERVQLDLAAMREESRRLLERLADLDANPAPEGTPGARWASVSYSAQQTSVHVSAAPEVAPVPSAMSEGTIPTGRPSRAMGSSATAGSPAGRALIAAAILGVCAWTAGTAAHSGLTHNTQSTQVVALVQR
ncbi:MAG: hypothetical protein NVS2B16_05100 [Chloroflexota bacterium]